MAFLEIVVKQAWERSSGLCECRRTTHGHNNRCYKYLKWECRGEQSEDGWEANHIIPGGGDTLENCEILCQDCYRAVKINGK